MRCEGCGVELDIGSVCDACADRRQAGGPNEGASTLSSLLIVFGAIVVLAIIVLTSQRREGYPHTKSLSDIKQLALATMQYAEDNNGTFPGWVRNPDGSYVHNVWDEQIRPMVKSKDVFTNGNRGIRSCSDPKRERVLTYGLNGLLITPPKNVPDGDGDFASASEKNPPAPPSPSTFGGNPADTILFAELATDNPMPGVYGMRPQPLMANAKPGEPGSHRWSDALDGWIDISPRAFIEVVRPIESNYAEPFAGYQQNGIARTLYGGGGSYAFCDGHAKFLRIGQTAGIDTVVDGKTVTPENCWEAWNTNNMWVPRAEGWAPGADGSDPYKKVRGQRRGWRPKR